MFMTVANVCVDRRGDCGWRSAADVCSSRFDNTQGSANFSNMCRTSSTHGSTLYMSKIWHLAPSPYLPALIKIRCLYVRQPWHCSNMQKPRSPNENVLLHITSRKNNRFSHGRGTWVRRRCDLGYACCIGSPVPRYFWEEKTSHVKCSVQFTFECSVLYCKTFACFAYERLPCGKSNRWSPHRHKRRWVVTRGAATFVARQV